MDVDGQVASEVTGRTIEVYSTDRNTWRLYKPSTRDESGEPVKLFHADENHFDSIGKNQKYTYFFYNLICPLKSTIYCKSNLY